MPAVVVVKSGQILSSRLEVGSRFEQGEPRKQPSAITRFLASSLRPNVYIHVHAVLNALCRLLSDDCTTVKQPLHLYIYHFFYRQLGLVCACDSRANNQITWQKANSPLSCIVQACTCTLVASWSYSDVSMSQHNATTRSLLAVVQTNLWIRKYCKVKVFLDILPNTNSEAWPRAVGRA